MFATNSLSILPETDEIFVLKDGKVVESGTYERLCRNAVGELAQLLDDDFDTVDPSGQKENKQLNKLGLTLTDILIICRSISFDY